MASLKGMIVEREPMMFPYLRETFYSIGIEHDDIRPSQTAIVKSFEMLTINVIKGNEVKREDILAMVYPQSSGSAPINWTAIEILVVFSLLR